MVVYLYTEKYCTKTMKSVPRRKTAGQGASVLRNVLMDQGTLQRTSDVPVQYRYAEMGRLRAITGLKTEQRTTGETSRTRIGLLKDGSTPASVRVVAGNTQNSGNICILPC